MAGRIFAFWRGFSHWLAVATLALLSGCTTLPEPQAPTAPALVAAPPAEPAAPVAVRPSPSGRSRLTDFLARRLHRPVEAPVVAPELSTLPEVPDTIVDEKYQLTGEAARELERGHASWYGAQFHGRRTASGENYDKYALTAAHKTLPFGTIVRVRSLKLGREVDVRINDRGPFSPGRVIDVSQAAAEALGLMGAGVAEVSLNVADSLSKAKRPSPSRKKPLRRTAAKPADPYRH